MAGLTLSAYRAEPSLGSPLPSVGLGKLGLSSCSRSFLLRCVRIGILGIVLVIIPTRSRFRFTVGDGAAGPELDHVDGTLAARDQMAAGQKDDLAR